MAPETCPNCGTEVPPNAKACPECGSDEKTGWSEGAYRESLGLPDDKFDYDDFVKHELSGEKPVPHGLHWFWWLVAVLLLAAFVGFWLR